MGFSTELLTERESAENYLAFYKGSWAPRSQSPSAAKGALASAADGVPSAGERKALRPSTNAKTERHFCALFVDGSTHSLKKMHKNKLAIS